MRYIILIVILGLLAGPALACEPPIALADAGWLAQRGDDRSWSEATLDDGHWTRISASQALIRSGQGAQDGFVWYRLHLQLTPAEIDGRCFVFLGRIQETDEIFLNGIRIGGEGRMGDQWFDFVSAMRQPRSYELPLQLLVDGENILAIRTFSLYLASGLPINKTRLGPPELTLREVHRLQRSTERIEVITLTLLILGALVTGFLSLSRQSERQHRMLFGLIIAVTTIYLVDSLLFYPVRLEAAWTKRLVFVAGPMIPIMLLQYLATISGERFHRMIWLLACLPLLCALPMLFNQPLEQIMRLYDVWFLSFAPIIVVLLAFLVRRARYRMQQSRLLLIAGLLIAGGLLFGLLGDGSVSGELNPVEFGILGMTAILMMAFARRLTREYKARLRLSAGVLSAQDEERRRIARELHDGLGQRLVAARLMLEAEVLKRPDNPLQEVIHELRDTTRELRAIVHGLRPVELGEVSLRSALVSYGQRMHDLTGVHIQVSHGHGGYIPSEIEEHLFRIVQEAVNNAIRHGSSQTIRIELTGVGSQLRLCIRDDGAGFQLEAVNDRGLGLTAMAERVRLCQGHFHIESRVGAGTTIRIEIPLS